MSEPVEGRYEGAAQEKATAPARPDIQHIPVGPCKICLKALCIQQFRGGSAVQSGESGRERVLDPVVAGNHIEVIPRLKIHRQRHCHPRTRLVVSNWMMLTSAMNGKNCVSATPRCTFDAKLVSPGR
jgi:hypothetical protein